MPERKVEAFWASQNGANFEVNMTVMEKTQTDAGLVWRTVGGSNVTLAATATAEDVKAAAEQVYKDVCERRDAEAAFLGHVKKALEG